MPTSLANVLRCERKFEIDLAGAGIDRLEVEAWVRCHSAMFRRTYPSRYVNNLYLDSVSLGAYLANAHGDMARCKTRIRWYGPVFGNIACPQLEFKARSGLVSRKTVHALGSLDLAPGFGPGDIDLLLRRSDLPDEVRARLAPLRVVLFNRYYRSYWETPNGRFRITIDTDMAGCPVDRLHNTLHRGYAERGLAVLELKYDTQYDDEADDIANGMPLRLSRHSKYVEGIERGNPYYQGGLPL